MDTFLHGCTDHKAALTTGEKSLKSMREAIRSVRHSIHNYRFIVGDKKVRSVSFPTDEELQAAKQPSVLRLEKDQLGELKNDMKSCCIAATSLLRLNVSHSHLTQ